MAQPVWTAEHEVDIPQAERLIAQQFPELLPLRLEVVGEGYDNTVYRVNEAYTFRFPRREIAATLLERECSILPSLESLGLPLQLPLLRYLGRPGSDGSYPWPFAGYTFVEGQPPNLAPNSSREKAARPLAKFLQTLHRFPVEQAQALGIQGDVLGRMDIEKRLGQLANNLEQALQKQLWPARDTAAVHAAMDAVRPLIAAMADRPRKLVHGDLHIRNVIADTPGTITGVIDWGDVHIGDPALDLSIAYSYIPPEARSLFFAAYGETDDAARRLARFFAIFVGFSLLVYGRDRGNLPLSDAAKASIYNAMQPDMVPNSNA